MKLLGLLIIAFGVAMLGGPIVLGLAGGFIGLLGGLFGIVVGLTAGLFGAAVGIVGGLFGAFFGLGVAFLVLALPLLIVVGLVVGLMKLVAVI